MKYIVDRHTIIIIDERPWLIEAMAEEFEAISRKYNELADIVQESMKEEEEEEESS